MPVKKPEPIRRFPPRFLGPLPRTPLPAPRSPYRISPKLPSDFERETPLSIAVSAGNDAVVILLLNHGAQLNDCVGEQTWTPPTHPAVSALLAGHESTLGTILQKDATCYLED
ncbi:Ankyrin repeat-containing domain [Penicillium roqueforti FM164]|uniref:Ankyrin repeat-containing domain n=1 Tax=Penicillium roqueforti (strain FM164) TaxID=1365484 RepID=W6R0Q4_PENRF|nr:Ankyrin repeat-containing domain [Penicillium roqueforti FM164]